MRDKVSIPRVALLHPLVRDEVARLIDKAEALFPAAIAIRIVQGLRTIAEQDALYAQGRTKPGKKVTNARGGKSFHNYGLAIDFAILRDKDGNGIYEEVSWDTVADFDKDGLPDWKEIVTVFEASGWKWGGKWSTIVDMPHLQKTFGYTWRKLFAKVKPGEKYVEL